MIHDSSGPQSSGLFPSLLALYWMDNREQEEQEEEQLQDERAKHMAEQNDLGLGDGMSSGLIRVRSWGC